MWRQKIGKLRRASCKKRGFRSGFRRVPGALLESKNACGCGGVAFSTRVPPRVPAGSAGLRPCKSANGLRLPAKNGGFLGQLLEGLARVFAGSRNGPLLDSGGIRAGSRFRRRFRWVLPWVPGMSAGFWPRSCENGPRLLVENDWPTPSRIVASSSVVLFIVGHCAAMVRSREAKASKRGQGKRGKASDAGACVVG